MKKLLFIFLILYGIAMLVLWSNAASAQIRSFNIRIGGHGGGGGTDLAIDTTHEHLYIPTAVFNETYNALRPNQDAPINTDVAFNINAIPSGYGGKVQFIITGTHTITPNGAVTGSAFPISGTFTRSYLNTGGVITWP
jgi:hypothetical protein